MRRSGKPYLLAGLLWFGFRRFLPLRPKPGSNWKIRFSTRNPGTRLPPRPRLPLPPIRLWS